VPAAPHHSTSVSSPVGRKPSGQQL
jgi:hypothetical protein